MYCYVGDKVIFATDWQRIHISMVVGYWDSYHNIGCFMLGPDRSCCLPAPSHKQWQSLQYIIVTNIFFLFFRCLLSFFLIFKMFIKGLEIFKMIYRVSHIITSSEAMGWSILIFNNFQMLQICGIMIWYL